jgi:NADH:ubiquinone oxidoreductase subunit K
MRWVRCNMHDNARLDDELAALTDRILSGEDVQTQPELDDLALVVRQLHEMIKPDARPDPAFRDRLTWRLDREWTLQHQRQARSWRSNRLVQLVALAAVVALLLFVLVLLSANGNDKPVQGTALGSITESVVIIAALVGLGLLVIWYRQRRNL